MRSWKGTQYNLIEDAKTRDHAHRVDQYLYELQDAISRLSSGQQANSSGGSISIPDADPATLATRIQHRWTANGPYIVDTVVDGVYDALHAFTITKTKLWRGTAGLTGTTTVVLKINGTTVDTLSIDATDGNNFTETSGVLAITVNEGDKLRVDTTAKETGTPLDWAYEFEGN